MQILAFFSNQTWVIKGYNMSEAMFYGNYFTEREDLHRKKAVILFYCNLVYKLKLIKQNVIFC